MERPCLGGERGEHSEVAPKTEEKKAGSEQVTRLGLRKHRVERRRGGLHNTNKNGARKGQGKLLL